MRQSQLFEFDFFAQDLIHLLILSSLGSDQFLDESREHR